MNFDFPLIIFLSLLVAIVRALHELKFFTFIFYKLRWPIGFFLLIVWSHQFIGYNYKLSLLTSSVFTSLALVSYRLSKANNFVVVAFYTVLSIVVLYPYIFYMFNTFSMIS